jgi:23S rRNA (uracil1939-C5)-methyltransferase
LGSKRHIESICQIETKVTNNAKNNLNLSYKLTYPELSLLFQPWEFIQANSIVNQSMIKQVMEILNPLPSDTILDLFCGIGNITLPLASKAKQVIGIEGDSSLIARAKENAKLNNIHNVEFFQCNLLQKTIPSDNWVTPGCYNIIILDPPRTGALELMNLLAQLKAKQILYISCDPATLARDIKILTQKGYHFKSAGIMDMFPQTSHVECMAFFELS